MSENVRPRSVFLFIAGVFLILFLISLLFPREGLDTGRGLVLYFPDPVEMTGMETTLRELTGRDQPFRELADRVLSGKVVTVADSAARVMKPFSDTISLVDIPLSDTALEGGSHLEDVLKEGMEVEDNTDFYPLHFSPGNDTVLYSFFNQLDMVGRGNGMTRVIHYGDSQIENDRISSVLRERFQHDFGGSGIGLFPVIPAVTHSAALQIKTTGPWQRYTALGRDYENNPHHHYGILLSYSMLHSFSNSSAKGSVGVEATGIGSVGAGLMKSLSVFCGFNKEPYSLSIFCNSEFVYREHVPAGDSLRILQQVLPEDADGFEINIEGGDASVILALSLDDGTGVAVDNVPLRGSSGLEFTRGDRETMEEMYAQVGAGLLLMQFGVNVVPYIEEDYSFYENSLFRQLEYLRSIADDIPVIVLGVSDMSQRVPGGSFQSYPNIPAIRDAQRNAAFRAGCAFWDVYEAMGGENSMAAWVEANPPLGRPDYIHFSNQGARKIGDMFYESVKREYEKYLVRKSENLN